MNEKPKLRIQLFNVGAGDHILIHLPNGEYGIVDFHFQDSRLNQDEPPAITFLRHKLDTHPEKSIIISFICISHYDSDHIKGLQQFFEWQTKSNIKQKRNGELGEVKIKNIWLAGAKDRDKLRRLLLEKINKVKKDDEMKEKWKDYENLLENYNKDFEEIEGYVNEWRKKENKDEKYLHNQRPIHGNLSPDIEAYCIAPLDKHIGKYENMNAEAVCKTLLLKKYVESSADNNLISSILFLRYKHKDKLKDLVWCFGGDASADVWKDSLNLLKADELQKKFPVASDFIKVSHHGSHNSSDPIIWSKLSENKNRVYFGISAGKKHNHPASTTLSEIKAIKNSVILSTNTCHNCVNNVMKFPNEDLDFWNSNLLNSFTITKMDNKFLFEKDLIVNQIRNTNPDEKGMLAYILDFDLNSGKAEVSVGISEKIEKLGCLFEKHQTKLFEKNCK